MQQLSNGLVIAAYQHSNAVFAPGDRCATRLNPNFTCRNIRILIRVVLPYTTHQTGPCRSRVRTVDLSFAYWEKRTAVSCFCNYCGWNEVHGTRFTDKYHLQQFISLMQQVSTRNLLLGSVVSAKAVNLEDILVTWCIGSICISSGNQEPTPVLLPVRATSNNVPSQFCDETTVIVPARVGVQRVAASDKPSRRLCLRATLLCKAYAAQFLRRTPRPGFC